MASLANLLGRILLAQLFMQAGLNKIFSYDGTIAYMATQHVSAMLLPLVIALETGGALALLLGWCFTTTGARPANTCCSSATWPWPVACWCWRRPERPA